MGRGSRPRRPSHAAIEPSQDQTRAGLTACVPPAGTDPIRPFPNLRNLRIVFLGRSKRTANPQIWQIEDQVRPRIQRPCHRTTPPLKSQMRVIHQHGAYTRAQKRDRPRGILRKAHGGFSFAAGPARFNPDERTGVKASTIRRRAILHPMPAEPVARPLGWVPTVWQLFHRRLVQSQVRLLGLSLLVGLVAGLAAMVFFVATVAAEHYLLGSIAGYRARAASRRRNAADLARADHDDVSPLGAVGHSAVGRIVHRLDRLHVRARGRRARHRRGDRSLSPPARE